MPCFLAIFLKIFVFKFSGQFFFKSYERFGNLISFSSSLSSSLPRPTALRSSTVAQPLGHRLGSPGADRAEASPADCEKPSMDSVMMSLSPVLESPPAALEEAPMRARERECCLLVLNLVSSTLSCIRQPRPRLRVLDVCGFV